MDSVYLGGVQKKGKCLGNSKGASCEALERFEGSFIIGGRGSEALKGTSCALYLWRVSEGVTWGPGEF